MSTTLNSGEVLLEAAQLAVADDRGVPRVKGVSFQVRAGEIVGIAGVEGNGQSELVEAITGLQPYQGQITYLGKNARGVREVEASGSIAGYMSSAANRASAAVSLRAMMLRSS